MIKISKKILSLSKNYLIQIRDIRSYSQNEFVLYQDLYKKYLEKNNFLTATTICTYGLEICKKDASILIQKRRTDWENKIIFLEQELLKEFKLNKYEEKISKYGYKKTNSKYKNLLQKMRKKAARELKTDNTQLKENTAKICKQISDDIIALVKEMITDCIKILGDPCCDYAVIALGSLARSEATPYSDLEFAILIEDKGNNINNLNKAYFRKLTKLLNFKVILLGETHPKMEYIKELMDLGLNPVKNGFSFDAKEPIACKTPLGNMHFQNLKREDKFELICTPEELAKYQSNKTFNKDPILSQTLLTITKIEGKKADKLINKYQSLTSKILNQTRDGNTQKKGLSIRQQRALQLLNKHIYKFVPGNRIKFDRENKSILPIKYELYRLPSLIFEALALFLGLNVNSSWERIKKMTEPNFGPNKSSFVNKQAASNLRKLINFTIFSRISNYLKKSERDHDIETNNYKIDSLLEDIQISEKDLTQLYLILLPLYYDIESFCTEINSGNYRFTLKKSFFKASLEHKVNMYCIFEKYKKAAKCCREILGITNKIKKTPINSLERLRALSNLANCLSKQGEIQEAISYQIQAIIFEKKLYGEDSYEVAQSYNNISGMFIQFGEYLKVLGKESESFTKQDLVKKALEHAKLSLKIRRKICKRNSKEMAATLNNLACIYSYLHKYKLAVKYQTEAFEISKNVFGLENKKTIDKGIQLNTYLQKCGNIFITNQPFLNLSKLSSKISGNSYNKTIYYQSLLAQNHLLNMRYKEAINLSLTLLKEKQANEPFMFYIIANSYKALAREGNRIRLFTKAIEYIKKSIEQCKKNKDAYNLRIYLFTYADILYSSGKYDEAIKVSLELLNNCENELEKAKIFDTLGLSYHSKKEKRKAYFYFIESLKLKKDCDESELHLANTLNNIGLLYFDTNVDIVSSRFAALHCFYKAYKIYVSKLGKNSKKTSIVKQHFITCWHERINGILKLENKHINPNFNKELEVYESCEGNRYYRKNLVNLLIKNDFEYKIFWAEVGLTRSTWQLELDRKKSHKKEKRIRNNVKIIKEQKKHLKTLNKNKKLKIYKMKPNEINQKPIDEILKFIEGKESKNKKALSSKKKEGNKRIKRIKKNKKE